MKKGRHRRFEEARALKRSSDIDFDRLLDSLQSESGPRSEDDEDDEVDDAYDDEDDDDR